MEGFKAKVVCSLAGVTCGLSGVLSLSNCSAGGCSSCFRCAGIGLGVVLMAALSSRRSVGRDDSERHPPPVQQSKESDP